MPSVRETIQKVLMPRLLVAGFRRRWPARLRAALRRLLGGRARIELYFAFDDPYAAIGLPPLAHLCRGRGVNLVLYPVVERGIADDPSAEQRRRHAIADSRWLARRQGAKLGRSQPLAPHATAWLAAWTEAARGSAGMAAFAAAALKRIWLSDDAPLRQDEFAELYRRHIQCDPPADMHTVSPGMQQALAANARRLRRKGHWESPAARVEGEWFLAHERLPQIATRLDQLGW